MPLPLLLPLAGLLGAGALTIGKEHLDTWKDKRLGRRFGDAVGGLLDEDPDASQFDIAERLGGAGLLSGNQFMQSAFGEENLLSEYGLRGRENDIAAQRQAQDVLGGHLFDVDKEFQPRIDAYNTELTDLQTRDRLLADIIQIPELERSGWLATPEGMAKMSQLEELEEKGFAAYKQQVYGDNDPGDEAIQALRGTYFSPTGGGTGKFLFNQGRYEQAREVYTRRADEIKRQAGETWAEYQRRRDMVRGVNGDPEQGNVQRPGGLFGSEVEAAPAGGGNVTVSSRSMPEGIDLGRMVASLLENGEVPGRELLASFIDTGGEDMDDVSREWVAQHIDRNMGPGTARRRRRRGGGAVVDGMDGAGGPAPAGGARLIASESGGNWGATNAEGMSGRAQFSPERLDEARNALGVNFSREQFLDSPQLQQAAEDWHFGDIARFIAAEGLDRYVGQRIGGVPITMQGMLNVAHLGGKAGLQRFIASGGRYDPADSNGTHLSDYLAMGAQA